MKNFKKLLSAAMALTMAASVGAISVSADDAAITGIGGATLNATTKVDSPIINVVVPSTFEFALNNYEIGGNGQIYSDDFTIVNKSNVPVDVGVTVATTVKTATLVDNADQILNNGTANAFLQLNYAKTWAKDSSDATTMDSTITYDTVKSTLGATSNFDFLLGASTYDTSDPPALTSLSASVPAASFKLTGSLDESFVWAASNIALKVSYKVTSMKGSTYTARNTNTAVSNAQGLVQPTLLAADNTKLATITVEDGKTLASSIVGIGAATVKSIGTYSTTTKKITALPTSGNYTIAGNTITWLKTPTSTDTFVFTMSDGTNYYNTAGVLSTTVPTA